jgi:hypothetical protein
VFDLIESLCREFSLDSSLPVTELTEELSRRRASIHPDKWGGAFPSEAAKSQFNRLSEALEYLRSEGPTALTVANFTELGNLATIVNHLQSSVELLRLDGSARRQADLFLRKEVSKPFRTIKISAGIFAAICGSILAFSGRLSTNVVLAPIAESEIAKKCILGLFLLSGTAFVLTWLNEHRLKNLMKFLLSEHGLSTVMYWCLNEGSEKEPRTAITKQDLVDNLVKIGNPPLPRFKPLKLLRRFFRIRVSNTFAEGIAEALLSRLIEMGVVRKAARRGVKPLYALDPSSAHEILAERPEVYHPWFW